MESARVSLRQTRDEVKADIEAAEENKEINEDDRFRFIEDLDKETKRLNDEIKAIRDKKEEDIMTI
jgi:ribosome recycling factor